MPNTVEAEMEKEFKEIGDMRIQVVGTGETIVFCHGFTTTSEFWRNQVKEFSQNRRVVLINLPGHGVSPAPHGRSYSIDAFVQDLEQVFDTLDIDKAILVGLSMGGTVAQKFALRNPQRLNALVLVGATPHGLGADVKAENVLAGIRELGVANASQLVIERSFGSRASAGLIDFAKQEVIQTPEHVAIEAIESLNRADSRAQLCEIKLPTLIVCGIEDQITPPSESRLLADGIPGAKLVLIEGAAHFPMLECPEEFNQTLGEFVAHVTQ